MPPTMICPLRQGAGTWLEDSWTRVFRDESDFLSCFAKKKSAPKHLRLKIFYRRRGVKRQCPRPPVGGAYGPAMTRVWEPRCRLLAALLSGFGSSVLTRKVRIFPKFSCFSDDIYFRWLRFCHLIWIHPWQNFEWHQPHYCTVWKLFVGSRTKVCTHSVYYYKTSQICKPD